MLLVNHDVDWNAAMVDGMTTGRLMRWVYSKKE